MSKGKFSSFEIQKLIFKEVKNDWLFYLLGISSMFAGVLTRLTTPVIIRIIIDQVLVNRDNSYLLPLSLSIIGISILSGIFGFGNRYFNSKASETTIFRLRNQMFDTIQKQSLSYLNLQESGQLMTKLTSDLDIVKFYLSRDFRLGVNAVFYFSSIGIIIYFTQVRFLVIFLFLLPILIVISLIYGGKAKPLFTKRRNYYSSLSSQIQEDIYAIETVRSFAQEDMEVKKFNQSNKEYLDLFMKSVIIRQLSLPVAVLLVSLGSVAVLYLGGVEIINGNLGSGDVTLGQLVQFNLYMLELTTPTRLLGNFITGYTRTNVSAERVFGVILSENSIVNPNNPIIVKKFHGDIEFIDVGFTYDNMQSILSGINLNIKSGGILGIIGGTGSGKSTLIQLLPRFYDPTDGIIKIDNTDIREYDLECLRKNIGIVSQETFLFSRTISENIAFGSPNTSISEIINVAKIAQAHDFIMEFNDGYDTIVGERGITLSGGQQQRISIARALLINPSILILDDSTASIDAATENDIQKALDSLMTNRTTIVISQKISSLRKADEIIVLEHGKILEMGTHGYLMKLNGIYSEIYRSQKDDKIVRFKL